MLLWVMAALSAAELAHQLASADMGNGQQ